jgi:flagellar biosynthesis regulator FlaF
MLQWITFIIALSALTLAVAGVFVTRLWKHFVEDLAARLQALEDELGVKKGRA